MARPFLSRLEDIRDNITQIENLLSGRDIEDVRGDRAARAAFERFLEIVSEASRHIPEGEKAAHPHIPWRRVADLGNQIRHIYDQVDLDILWQIYLRDITPLRNAVDAMLDDKNNS